jgi:hypothetical protein
MIVFNNEISNATSSSLSIHISAKMTRLVILSGDDVLSKYRILRCLKYMNHELTST